MTTPRVITTIQRPTNTLLDQYTNLSSALLHEALGKRGAFNHDVKPVYPGARIVGVALPIKGYPGDNLMLHLAISLAKPGDVLVATVEGYTEAGIWGEIASTAALARGIKGLVTDGAVRDVDATAALNFPVFARGISIKGTTKKQAGYLNSPINIAGVTVNPGDIILGDTDGVVVVPLEEAEKVLVSARKIIERESRMLEAITCEQALTLDLLQLRTTISELGLEQE
jgi:4-hydroxy-4-methyl-2-oxoglutarate aldolase